MEWMIEISLNGMLMWITIIFLAGIFVGANIGYWYRRKDLKDKGEYDEHI